MENGLSTEEESRRLSLASTTIVVAISSCVGTSTKNKIALFDSDD